MHAKDYELTKMVIEKQKIHASLYHIFRDIIFILANVWRRVR